MSKKSKRILSFALAATMTASVLAGCGQEGGTSGSTAQSGKNSGTTLTFGSHQSGLPNSGIVQKLAAEFEKQTGIKVDFQISPDDQWRDLIKVKLNSGEAPDIICADSNPLTLPATINPARYCVDLSNESWINRMDKDVLPSVSVNNKAYGITFPGKKMYFFIYNKDIFKKCGITKLPTTYAELKNTCATIKSKMPEITPIYEATTDGWHQVLPIAENPAVYLKDDSNLYSELNANKKDLNDIPKMKTILNEEKELANLGYYGKDYLSNATSNAKEAMAKGKTAMYIAESAFRNQIKTEYPDCKYQYGIFVQPWADNQTIGVNPASNAYFINKNSKNVDAAKKFFDFLAKPENLQKRLDGQPDISEVCWPEIKGRYSAEDQKYISSHKTVRVFQVSVNYFDNQFMDIGKDIESMFTGAMTPDDVIKSTMKRRDNQAKLQKDPAFTS
jgi:raffinose/stachyose/melibiose transport system substrate-binding protein